MPRRKPPQNPVFTKKSEFVYHKDFSQSNSCPCLNKRCNGFMFLTIKNKEHSKTLIDVLECFLCKKTKKLGSHIPNRKVR